MIPNIRSSRDGLSVTIADRVVDISANRTKLWLTAIGFAVGLGFALYLFLPHPFEWTDGDAYWLAAERLRNGQELYVGEQGFETYRYAPWLAWAWVPLTYLPKELVTVTWQVAMLACVPLAVVPAWNTPLRPLAAFSAPLLIVNAIGGNIQPALVAMLVWIPWGSGLAASLKPLALVVEVLRRDWVGLAVSVAVAGVLWAPALLYDLSAYPAFRGFSHYDLSLLLGLYPVYTTSSLNRSVSMPEELTE